MAVLEVSEPTRFRRIFTGLAADTKPTPVQAGAIFVEYDTGLIYYTYDDTSTWIVLPLGGGGGGAYSRIFTSSAASTTTITAAALADVATEYIGQMVLPLQGAMAGEGRYITDYNGTNQLTVSPAWAADPDAGGNILFAVVSGAWGFIPPSLGLPSDTATAENLSDVATTSLHAKIRRALLGIGHATYGLSALLTAIGGAALASVLGALNDAASIVVNTSTTVISYIKGLLNETAKIPKSDSNVTWNTTALASVNAEVDTALNTAIPGTNTTDSANDILLDQLKPRLPAAGTIATTADLITSGDILCFRAVVTSGGATTGFVASTMASYGVNFFVGWTAYVVCDTAGAAPAREFRVVEAYTTASGTFAWTPVLSAALGNGDIVYLIHPSIDLTIIGLDHLLALTDGANNYPNNAVAGSVIAKIVSKAAAGATPSGYDCTTDSLEMLSDKLGAFTGDGGAAQDDSVKAALDLLHTLIDLIPTTAMRGTDNAALASVLGALNDAAATGAVSDAKTIMSYVKQLVTAILLIPTTAMRGTDNAALASVLGALNTAAATGAVTDADEVMAYTKQLVTDLRALITTIGTPLTSSDIQAADAAALAAVAYTRQAGVMQVKATTFELNQAAATYTLLTGTTQDVEIESVAVRNLTDMTGGGTTSFSIQTNDTTAQTFISSTNAVKASLTVGAQFSWVGSCILKATKLIQLTVNGAACGGTDVMDIVVTFRAIVTGGYLA